MSNIGSRLDRLEKTIRNERPRIVWMEKGDTEAQALTRVAPLGPGESPVFVGWAR